MEERKIALLIDSDNISAKYIKYILDEISKYGTVTYKRIYGDWTRSEAGSWKEVLLENSIVPIQQYNYTVGKNATDSAMIIDAMDILYSNKVNGFCLASSDSDFTRLATRLREAGMMVIGMGEKKTPEPFRAACERFTYLDVLAGLYEQEMSDQHNAEETETNIDIKEIENAMIKIITENSNDGKDTGLGELGSRLVKMFPDFDVRNYGYTKLTKFLERFKSLDIKITGSTAMVSLATEEVSVKEVSEEIYNIIKSKGETGISMGELSNKLYLKIKGFNLRDYGYSKFSKFIQDLPNVQITVVGRNQMVTVKPKH